MISIANESVRACGYGLGGIVKAEGLGDGVRGKGILPLFFIRRQDAGETQGRDALATKKSIAKWRLTMPPGLGAACRKEFEE